MAMANPFTEHPRSVGETYLEHGAFACRYGAKMALGGLAATLEASAARAAARREPSA